MRPFCVRLLLFATAMALLAPGFCRLPAEEARRADDFVDFIGVNTHLGYNDTTYRDYDGIIKPRLLQLGVRHIRDGTFSNDVLRKYLDLGQHSIRLLLITDSRHAIERAQKLGPTLLALEISGSYASTARRSRRSMPWRT